VLAETEIAKRLEVARELADRLEPGYRRVAATLARSAIEQVARDRVGLPASDRPSVRSTFILLRATDESLSRDGYHLWSALSEIVHYSPSDLIPERGSVVYRVDETSRWIERAAGRGEPSAYPNTPLTNSQGGNQ
jgi:hypothetical protein